MPSEKPVLRMRTTDENIIKIKFIAKQNKRSVSKELELILEKHIAEYEQKHGTINIEIMSPKQIVEDVKDRILGNPPYGGNV